MQLQIKVLILFVKWGFLFQTFSASLPELLLPTSTKARVEGTLALTDP